MRYVYPCDIAGNETDGDGFVAVFPDVNGAITGGFTFKEALINAEDCLVVALASCVDCGEELPAPSSYQEGQELLTVQARHRCPVGPLHRHARAGHQPR